MHGRVDRVSDSRVRSLRPPCSEPSSYTPWLLRTVTPAVKNSIGLALFSFLFAGGAFGAEPRAEDVTFTSHGATLSGSIVFPDDSEVRAAVVFVHGSGKQARNLGLARRFAEAGIAALVYDKRGAGASGGEYEGEQSVSEKNIGLLADDANAAFDVLKHHPALKDVKVGLAGISQAGWIVPVAAQKSGRADFLLLWSSPVCKVSEEDIFSKYTADRDASTVPRYEDALRARTTPYVWPDFLGVDTDPAVSLKMLSIPGLWLFSDNDGSIPVDLSIERLGALREDGHRYDYVLFPGAGHNNMGATFATAVDWVRRL